MTIILLMFWALAAEPGGKARMYAFPAEAGDQRPVRIADSQAWSRCAALDRVESAQAASREAAAERAGHFGGLHLAGSSPREADGGACGSQVVPRTTESASSGGEDASEVRAWEILQQLEKTRSERWCATTRGLVSLLVQSLGVERHLIDELASAAAERAGSWSHETALKAASNLAGAGREEEALGALGSAAGARLSGDALFLNSLCLDRLDRTAEAAKGFEMYARSGGLLADYALLLAARCMERQGYKAAGAKVLAGLVAEMRDSPIWGTAALELCQFYISLERYEDCAGIAELVASSGVEGLQRHTGLYYLGRALKGAGRDAEAAQIYWKLVRNHPSHPKAGLAFREIEAIKDKLNLGLSDDELYRGGLALFKTGNLKEAQATLQKLVSRGRDGQYWRDGVLETARVCYARRRYTEAAEKYRLLAEEGGQNAEDALLWVGKSELRAGRYRKAFEILEAVGHGSGSASVRAEALWEAGREKESQGLVADAVSDYSYSAGHLSHAPLGPETCWRLGFCLYIMEDWQGAAEAFERAARATQEPYLRAQSHYWLAKALRRLDRPTEAERALKAAADQGPSVYYGARAAWILNSDFDEIDRQAFSLPGEDSPAGRTAQPPSGVLTDVSDSTEARLGADPGRSNGGPPVGADSPGLRSPVMRDPAAQVSPAPLDAGSSYCLGAEGHPGLGTLPSEAAPTIGSARWHYERGLRLLWWGEPGWGAAEIRMALKLGVGKEKAVGALNFFGSYIHGIRAAGNPSVSLDSQPMVDDLYASFPLGFADIVWRHSAESGLDPYLALAIIRQESRFEPQAVSRAGARGLMQIMPSTGRKLARDLGIRWRGRSSLLNPETNIRMGTKYFVQLQGRLANLPATLAAYNGGASKAQEWALLAEGKGLDAYIEMIGYRETRTYVKLVILQYLTYLRLYNPAWRCD